jgi:hypothetical protein
MIDLELGLLSEAICPFNVIPNRYFAWVSSLVAEL